MTPKPPITKPTNCRKYRLTKFVEGEVRLCPACNCMTKTTKGRCGKCGNSKVSRCCSAGMKVVSGDEGTSYYECLQCGNPCDAELLGSREGGVSSSPDGSAPKSPKWENEWKQLNPSWTKVQLAFISDLLKQQKIKIIEAIGEI